MKRWENAFQCSLATLRSALFAVFTAAQLSNSWRSCVIDSAYVNMHLLLALPVAYSHCCIRLGPDSNGTQLQVAFFHIACHTSLNRWTTKRQLLVHSLLWSETKMPGVIVLYIVQILGKSPREESSWNKDIWLCTGCRNNWFQRIMYKASCNKQ